MIARQKASREGWMWIKRSTDSERTLESAKASTSGGMWTGLRPPRTLSHIAIGARRAQILGGRGSPCGPRLYMVNLKPHLRGPPTTVRTREVVASEYREPEGGGDGSGSSAPGG